MFVKVAQSCLPLCGPMDCSPWNTQGQNTGARSLSLLQRIFPTHGLNPGLPHCTQILYQLSHKGSQEHRSGQPIPSAYLPDPGLEPGSPALQADSLPMEISGKPLFCNIPWLKFLEMRKLGRKTKVLVSYRKCYFIFMGSSRGFWDSGQWWMNSYLAFSKNEFQEVRNPFIKNVSLQCAIWGV